MNEQEMPAEIQEAELPELPKRPKEKKIIHFASGETLEVEDSEEEEEEEESLPKRGPFKEEAKNTGFPFKKLAILTGTMSLQMCDFLGKRFAAALGLNMAKYQYAFDQYHHHQKATRSRVQKGPAESFQLPGRPAGSRYGATENGSGTAAPLEKHEDSAKGYHNRGYLEDEENSK